MRSPRFSPCSPRLRGELGSRYIGVISMRGTRWLLLVAIAVISVGVALKYRAQIRTLREQAPPKPVPLSTDLNSAAQHWQFRDKDHKTGRIKTDIDAESMQQVKDSSRVDLKGVTMKLYSPDAKTYNLVKCAAASLYTADGHLYSEGDVEITMRVPVAGQATHPLTSIKSSAVTVDRTTGRADTDKPASFIFERGDGKSTGAVYDPVTHALQMKSGVEVHWNPPGPHAKPMKIEAGGLTYHEDASQIWLKPWGRMTREKSVVDGKDAVIHLQDRKIRRVTAIQARGTDVYPNRQLHYSADELAMDFDDDGLAQKIAGQTNAQIVSSNSGSETTVSADHVDMNFDTGTGESVLSLVTAAGKGVVTSKPLPAPGRQLSETHVLRSEAFDMQMRPGGHEIDRVVTKAPGTLEFIPNLPAQHHRLLDGKEMIIAYGPMNRIDSFRAKEVRTQTDPTADERKRTPAIAAAVTTSRELEARFDPKTSRMSEMRQTGDFTYEEGDRKARAASATLNSEQNLMRLETSARVADATGSTAADHIRLDQRTGDFTAEGNVTSSRLPDKDPKKNSEMLSGDEPLQAVAQKMDARNRNRNIRYEGGVTMTQGANRIQADTIDLDREKRGMVADGHVVTNLWEAPKAEAPKVQPAASATPVPNPVVKPVLTEVRAAHLVYTEETRLAVYTGGVQLTRPGLRVKGLELRSFLSQAGDSRLEKAFVDGTVEIFQTGKDRTRTGTGEHAEYYTDDQKVILRGGKPRMVEKIDGEPRPNVSEGIELTYFANDARLLVTGDPNAPGNTRINRKKKK